jgi:4-azaleucine resistance transporter AzlC
VLWSGGGLPGSPFNWWPEVIEVDASRGFLEGLRASVPIVVGYLPAAVAFGVAARGAGLSVTETVAMSLIVFSGASQFALAGLLTAGASWVVMAAISLVLGVRHMLYGPSLAPNLRRIDTSRAAAAAFGLTDEVFAVASAMLPRRPLGTNFGRLVGLGTGAYISWTLGTWIGAAAGSVVVGALPSLAPALSFALPALFVALLVSLVRSTGPASGGAAPSSVMGAILVAAAVAATLYLAGLESWSVPAAGVTGPTAGLLIQRGRANAV